MDGGSEEAEIAGARPGRVGDERAPPPTRADPEPVQYEGVATTSGVSVDS
jgi:hypothetical protein